MHINGPPVLTPNAGCCVLRLLLLGQSNVASEGALE